MGSAAADIRAVRHRSEIQIKLFEPFNFISSGFSREATRRQP
jgi:hypothetical protein